MSPEPRDGDRVRIVSTGPSHRQFVYEGIVRRQHMDIPGFELTGVRVNTGEPVALWFSVDSRHNKTPGFEQTTTILQPAQAVTS